MDAITHIDLIEEMECGECGYHLWHTSEGYLQCENKDCKEFGVKYNAPDKVVIKLDKV